MAIYHLSQSKGGMSSVELARRLGTRQPTAWLVKHKLMAAIQAREALKPKLAGRVADRRRLSRRAARGRQARPGRRRHDVVRGRGRDDAAISPLSPAAARRRPSGLPSPLRRLRRRSLRRVKGLSEAEFRERFGTEAQCRAALFQLRWGKGWACPACGHGGCAELKGRAVYQCNRCKHQVGLTAGTVFHWTKLPLTTWFLAIYHLTQSKGGMSSVELARRLGTRQPTAWLLKHKLMAAMEAREAEKPKLAGRVEVDDAYLGGAALGRQARPGCRRQDAVRGRGRDDGRAQAAGGCG